MIADVVMLCSKVMAMAALTCKFCELIMMCKKLYQTIMLQFGFILVVVMDEE